MKKEDATNKAIPATDQPSTRAAESSSGQPYEYIGPMPPPTVSNLPCKCTLPANQLSRAQQDYLIQTNPPTAAWFVVVP